MKNAIQKQNNVSVGVKNGMKELEEVIDIITFSKTSWKKADEQMWKNVCEETCYSSSPLGDMKWVTTSSTNLEEDGKERGNTTNQMGTVTVN